eukprot:m.127869 g.127869  ORF g.127869 m.127869 type:complete len:127 (+) comp13014_c7_seq13:1797-2177(+)
MCKIVGMIVFSIAFELFLPLCFQIRSVCVYVCTVCVVCVVCVYVFMVFSLCVCVFVCLFGSCDCVLHVIVLQSNSSSSSPTSNMLFCKTTIHEKNKMRSTTRRRRNTPDTTITSNKCALTAMLLLS